MLERVGAAAHLKQEVERVFYADFRGQRNLEETQREE
jgi:hypothetical protein